MAVTLSGAARKLGLPDNRQVRGIAEFLGIPLRHVGNQIHIQDDDFRAISRFMGHPARMALFRRFQSEIEEIQSKTTTTTTTRHDTTGDDSGQDR